MSDKLKLLPLGDRWAADEQLLAEIPRELDTDPRWITDDLGEQYGPDAPTQPTMDDLPDGDR